MYSVEYSSQSIKELRKLDPPTAKLLYAWIEKNLVDCTDPRTQGKALVGNKRGYWRYGAGIHRIIAEINDNQVTVFVISVGHRKDVY